MLDILISLKKQFWSKGSKNIENKLFFLEKFVDMKTIS